MSTYDSYRLYNSLKLHFNSESYNYFRYSGKIKSGSIPENQYYIFEKVYKKHGSDLENFYLSNFLENPKLWVNDLLSEECEERYKYFLGKKESLTYTFKNDISSLIDEYENLNDLIIVSKDFPILMKKTLQGKIDLNTLLIMNSILRFFPMWDKHIQDNLIWEPFKLKCKKYFPFIKFDQEKMKEILKVEVKKCAK